MIDNKTKEDMIQVAIQILDTQKTKYPCHFGSLVKTLDGRISRNTISKCIDILTDMGILKYSWNHDINNRWYRSIEISSCATPLIEGWTNIIINDI